MFLCVFNTHGNKVERVTVPPLWLHRRHYPGESHYPLNAISIWICGIWIHGHLEQGLTWQDLGEAVPGRGCCMTGGFIVSDGIHIVREKKKFQNRSSVKWFSPPLAVWTLEMEILHSFEVCLSWWKIYIYTVYYSENLKKLIFWGCVSIHFLHWKQVWICHSIHHLLAVSWFCKRELRKS